MTFGIDVYNFCLSLYNSTTPSSALWTLVVLSLKQKIPLGGESLTLQSLEEAAQSFYKFLQTYWLSIPLVEMFRSC